MIAPNFVLAYLSPDTVLPLTSILAMIAGGAMFLTRGSVRFVVRCFRAALRRPRRAARPRAPHFDTRRAMVSDETRE
jgi:hypothetical protein